MSDGLQQQHIVQYDFRRKKKKRRSEVEERLHMKISQPYR